MPDVWLTRVRVHGDFLFTSRAVAATRRGVRKVARHRVHHDAVCHPSKLVLTIGTHTQFHIEVFRKF